MLNRTGLVPPYSGNAGDGNAAPETAELIREEIEFPIRDARTGALKDAVTYLTDNAVNDAGHNIRAAINIRWNLPWTVVDAIIKEAAPLAEIAIKKAKAKRDNAQREQTRFEKLEGLFVEPVRVQKEKDGDYTLSGLTEFQIQMIADILAGIDGDQ